MLQLGSQTRLQGIFTGGQSAKGQRSLVIAQSSGKHANAAATEQAGNSNGAANALDFDELTEIIRMVNETDIVELELKSKKFSLTVRKKDAIERPEPIYQQIPQAGPAPPQAPAPAAPAPSAPSPKPSSPPPSSSSPPSNGSSAGGVEVASPMSGTFYHSPAPGEPPFVKLGDKVTKGQTIGIIEAMKLMNEIEADAAGTVTEFIADNGSSVSPGQASYLDTVHVTPLPATSAAIASQIMYRVAELQ